MLVEQQAELIATQEARIEHLVTELRLLRQRMFGKKSEALHPDQLRLFLNDGPAADAAPAQEPTVEAKGKRKKKGHGRGPLPAHLPREEIVLDVPESERCCAECDEAMQLIGEDVTERGHMVPARFVVKRYIRKKYACKKGHGVLMAPMPDGVVDGGKYEASVHAHVAVAKYADHTPLNRLEGIFKRCGVHIPRQSLWDMLVRVDEIVAQPILAQMRHELLDESVLHADETPVTVRLEGKSGGRTSKGFVFVWRSLQELPVSKILFDFRTSRASAGPTAFLGPWSGTLIIDGYSGYNEVCTQNGIVRSGCWSHARRKFKDALDGGNALAAKILLLIQRLFRIERLVKALADRPDVAWTEKIEFRRRVRERVSARVLDAIHAEAERLTSRRDVLPKSKLGDALTYLHNQRAALSVPLEDARLPIHNNDAERSLRHVAVGRKNWLVFASEKGGRVAARLYSLMLTCRELGVDPQAYIEDVMGRVSTTRATEIASLTPWAWAAERSAAQQAASE